MAVDWIIIIVVRREEKLKLLVIYFTIYDGQLVIFSILIFMVCDTVIEL